MNDDIVNRLRDKWQHAEGLRYEAAKEIERLREALREVANADFLDFSLAPERSASAIARAALVGEKTND
jgi:hypothetical protein